MAVRSGLVWSGLRPRPGWSDLVDVVLLAERVEDDVDLVEHVHHLHGRDVDADLVELDHVAEQDGHVGENLRGDRRFSGFRLTSDLRELIHLNNTGLPEVSRARGFDAFVPGTSPER